MRKLALALSSLCFFATLAHAQEVRLFLTGNDLLDRCSAEGYNHGLCEGYVMAIADAMSGDNTVVGLKACLDVKVRGAQVVEIVVAALHRKAADRQLSARSIVADAIADAFPCPPRYGAR